MLMTLALGTMFSYSMSQGSPMLARWIIFMLFTFIGKLQLPSSLALLCKYSIIYQPVSDVQMWSGGCTHWPDFMNPKTWTWWQQQIQVPQSLSHSPTLVV